MDLIYGAGQLNRRVQDAEDLLSRYLTDIGLRYLEYRPITPWDSLVPEDLAVTILINSRVSWRAFESVQDHGPVLDLGVLPSKPLERTTEQERQVVAELIAQVASWPGLAASVATKVLHKKRPDLIPILENQAIFGAYMNPAWPGQPSWSYSVYDAVTIWKALDWIAADLTWRENADTWRTLQSSQPKRSLIELFDMVWWAHFRSLEPVRAVPAV
jgi:hypothetical protein